jgi:hypothetical protein
VNQVDLFGDQIMPEQHGSKLGGDWDYPPFSVLNAREGWWQDRKRAWLSLGIRSELGRGGGQPGASGQPMTAQAFDVRHGLATWQKDKRNG